MKNCRFCHKPTPDVCYILVKGCLSGKEFKVCDEAEFVCESCVASADDMHEPDEQTFEIGDITLVGEE